MTARIKKFFFWEFQWYSKILLGFLWTFFLCARVNCIRFLAFGRVGVCDLTFIFRFFLFLSLAHVKLTPRVCLLLLNCFMVIENVWKLNSLIVNRSHRRCRRCCNFSQSNFGRFFLSRHHHHQHSLSVSHFISMYVAFSTSLGISPLFPKFGRHTWKDALKMNMRKT